MALEQGVTITWLGHAATKIEMADGRIILIDPFIENNPATPEEQKQIERLDLMLLSHGHGDNLGDAVSLATRFNPSVMANNELCAFLTAQGVENCSGGNVGGTQRWNDVEVTLVEAVHSSSAEQDGQAVYTGLAVGFIIRFSDGFTIYHAGDTAIFDGMNLIGQLYEPDVALLPIGDHYTMGPREAAEAIRLLGVKRVIPIHYGTFPVLTGTPERLEEEAADVGWVNIISLSPGESVAQAQLA